MVGTQTITKGYHFSRVTLVGVIWADSNLNFPVYNAQETVLQQLIQVAGRAGRNTEKSEVIVQSMTNNTLFNYINELKYLDFYQQEIAQRELVWYPPAARLAEIELKYKTEAVVEQEAFFIASKLMKFSGLMVLGPAEPPVSKINKLFSRKIYIKASNFGIISQAYISITTEKLRCALYFTPNPQT